MDFGVQNTFIHYRPSVSSRREKSWREKSWPPALLAHSEDFEGDALSDASRELGEMDESRQEAMRKTALMIRNLPCKVNAKRLEAELHLHGFRGAYDNVHVPTRPNGSGKGYGFVNFLELPEANRFVRVFDGYSFLGSHSAKKLCYVVAADRQGIVAV
eukprot:TRINITY_DN57723_c0_g1_i1.p1 TRINITY_DN57723_c0_g1~~TRINITY_DN57723_c0_g1_i1.p1  ORF type:complete len:158 (+),score=21.58 TRINITY_DN57723_c0_g1_i1:61-534(+)